MVQQVKIHFDIFIFGFGRVRFSILESIIAVPTLVKNLWDENPGFGWPKKWQCHKKVGMRLHPPKKIQDETGFFLLNPPPKCVVTHCRILGVCHTLALPFTLKSILMRKKNYGNSNISPCKNLIFKKCSKRNQNPSRYYNSIITNLKFQHKPNYHLSKILISK
jgi:hypothetical protein